MSERPYHQHSERGYPGGLVERDIIESMLKKSKWDSRKWGEKSKGTEQERQEAQEELAKWVEEYLAVTRAEWRRLSKEEQLQMLLEWCRGNQPDTWNPAEPLGNIPGTSKVKNNFGDEFHNAIAEGLGFEDYDRVKLFCAVDTPVDNLFHTDCFAQIDDYVLTIDITTNPAKRGGNLWDERLKTQNMVVFLERPGELDELIDRGREVGAYIKRRLAPLVKFDEK